MNATRDVLVVGLGSAHGDDQAGWVVAESFAELCRENPVAIVRRAAIPLDVLDWLDDVKSLHVCDACESTTTREMLHRLSWTSIRSAGQSSESNASSGGELTSLRSRGSHDFSLPDVLQLADRIHCLPDEVTIWAIEGFSFQPGEAMTAETRLTALRAAAEIMKELTGSWESPLIRPVGHLLPRIGGEGTC